MSQPKKQLEDLLELYDSPEELLADLSMALIEERLSEDDMLAQEDTAPAAELPRLLA